MIIYMTIKECFPPDHPPDINIKAPDYTCFLPIEKGKKTLYPDIGIFKLGIYDFMVRKGNNTHRLRC